MERCLEIVEVARPNSSVIWQTHNSPRRSDRSIRTRFGSDNALVMVINCCILFVISPTNEIIIAGKAAGRKWDFEKRRSFASPLPAGTRTKFARQVTKLGIRSQPGTKMRCKTQGRDVEL